MKVNTLHNLLEEYPKTMADALKALLKAEKTVEKIQALIDEEEERLTLAEPINIDSTDKLSKLEYEQSLLELNFDKIKGKIELEYRNNPVHTYKITEATVEAFVKSSPEYIGAKTKIIDKKLEKAKLKALMPNFQYPSEPVLKSDKLDSLKLKLYESELAYKDAEIAVEEIKAKLSSYQLLVQLYTSGLIKSEG